MDNETKAYIDVAILRAEVERCREDAREARAKVWKFKSEAKQSRKKCIDNQREKVFGKEKRYSEAESIYPLNFERII